MTKAWQKVAEHFKGNKYVIAYDLLNEPWVGNQIRNPFLLIPGVAEKVKLQKFYDRLSESIR
jgi:aryl-phospho-beta-D-glucosidase BglC (GH1 family)